MLALIGATVMPISRPPLEQATILIENGKIVAVGQRIEIPAGCEVMEVNGKVVTPGLIDAHTHLGVYAESLDWSGEDANESSQPLTPGMHVIDALNPDDIGLADACAGGITTVMVAPGSANPVGGQCMIVKTRRQDCVEDMIVNRYAGLKIAFGENPRRVYGGQKKMPVTRMATASLIREILIKGKEYICSQGDKERKTDLGLEAVTRVLRHEMPLRAHAHRADDIMTALRIADEFKLDIIIEHATEAHLIAGVLAQRRARLVLGPLLPTRVKMELKERSWRGPGILEEHGVLFALMSDHPVVPSCFLPVYAGLAVRYGLSAERALAAITLDAATILGMEDRIGSIDPGKEADLVVWSGHPLQLASYPEIVVIGGSVGHVDRTREPMIHSWK